MSAELNHNPTHVQCLHLKSWRPFSFWVEFQPQWSVATRCSRPPARPLFTAAWWCRLRRGGLMMCAAALLKSGSQLRTAGLRVQGLG